MPFCSLVVNYLICGRKEVILSVFCMLLVCEELGKREIDTDIYKYVIYLLSKFNYFNVGFTLE